MTTELVTLERELSRLANDFATHLIKAALHARVEELVALRDYEKPEPAAFPIRLASTAPEQRERAVRALAPAPPRVRVPRKPRQVAPAASSFEAAPMDEADDLETAGNTITDPSLLLDGIASAPPSAPPSAPRYERANRGGPSPLLDVVDASSDLAQGPVLRPGERLQRTAGGNVVLRRGRG